MRKLINEVKLNFLSRSCNEAFSRTAAAAFVTMLDPTIDELSDVKTIVSEAVTNCIVHAYGDGIGVVYIHLKAFDDRTVYISVKDKGCGIEDVKKALEPMYTTGRAEERSGLGFSVMGAFADKLSVRSKFKKGTVVVMTKKLKQRNDGSKAGG